MKNILFAIAAFAATASAYAAPLPCKPQDKVDVKAIKPRVILLGEMGHGTVEAPAFAAAMACSLLQDGRQVVLALEVPADRQAALDRYLASEGSEADARQLRESDFGALTDGRSSHAMLALVEQARVLRAAGAPLVVSAADVNWKTEYDRPMMDLASERERSEMIKADTLLAVAGKNPAATVLGLYGATHASLAKGIMRPEGFEPMAYRVAKQLPVHSIGLGHVGGTAWACWPDLSGKGDCAAHSWKAEGLGAPYMSATVDIGRITASPPMRQQ